ncbi:hypothetical protein Lalb_Chr03g0042511 [Lupinus albus]|uniref:Uncharacterized protein n=1 Tax=Lupinus albus TaxID=3870 RepID=A0A6A4QTE7_LUPAL|nr:hypothetical protein Lalb_Chr03g0042511 [Lupinus albus]
MAYLQQLESDLNYYSKVLISSYPFLYQRNCSFFPSHQTTITFLFLCFPLFISSVFLCLFPLFFSVFIQPNTLKMEGIIPFVYKAIMQYKNGKEGSIVSCICDSPSYSYMKLPGDSGRFQTPASFSVSSPSFSPASSATQVLVSSSVHSPHHCFKQSQVAT